MKTSRPALSWAFYDWANSAFTTVVLAGFFPIFFREFWGKGLESAEITWYLGLGNSIASLILVVIAPILGAIADQGGLRKKLLVFTASLSILMTASFFWLGQGMWLGAILLFIGSTSCWMAANIFYDSLLIDVAEPEDFDRISALGYGIGYLGGGLLFAICVAMTLKPAFFGFDNVSQAVSVSFLITAVWWAVFSIPLILNVEPKKQAQKPIGLAIRDGLKELRQTLTHLRQLKVVVAFLFAYWLYIDGVDTLIRMAVDYGKSIGIGSNDLIVALLLTQFISFPAAIVFGRLGQRIGARNAILLAIANYCAITLLATQMDSSREFFLLAAWVGLIQGGIQALSRSYYAKIIPQDKSAEFFGFYNMMGKFAAVLGPLMVGWIGLTTGNQQWGMASLLLLFIAGAILLLRVPNIK